jgi:hypothetical protein
VRLRESAGTTVIVAVVATLGTVTRGPVSYSGAVRLLFPVREFLAVLGLVVLAAAAGAAPAHADNNLVYSGTLDGSTTAAGSGDTTSAHVSWSEIGSSPTSSPSTVTWSLPTLSGALTFSGDASSNTPSCSSTLSAAPNPNKAFAPGIAPVTGGYEVLTWNPASVGSAGSGGSPMSYQVQSTAPYDTTCGAPYGIVSNIEACARNNVALDAALRPYAVFPAGSSVKRFDIPSTGGPCGSSQFSFSISSSIQFNGDPVTGTPPPTSPPTPPPGGPPNVPPSPTKAKQKLIALDDIVKSLPRTSAECYDSAKGSSLAALFNGGRLTPEAAALLVPTADVLCGADLRNLLHDWVVVNDPPDSHFRSVAVPAAATLHGVRLPACRGHGRTGRFCRALRPKLLSLILAARTVESVNAAMQTIINRISGAQRAHNAAGVRRQGAAAVRLRARMRRAVAARDTLGVSVAKEIRASGVGVKLNQAQDSTGVGFVLKSLAKDRVTISAFTARAGAAATPKQADLLALL